jgi:type IV secretion system protein VirB1
MDLITLIATCAPMVAPTAMKAIVLEESRGHPYAIHDGKTHRAIFPKTRAEAVATARRLIAGGSRIDAGLAQINSENWGWLGLDAESVFDPCTNLNAGERVLLGAYTKTPFTMDAAISRYNTGHAVRGIGNGYVGRVKAWMPKPQPDRQYAIRREGEGAGPVVANVSSEADLVADATPASGPLAQTEAAAQAKGKPWHFEAVLDGFGGG